ncbi:MAG: lipid-A-disaccharide synthase [Nitrospiraceae bacterium]|nr:lipid-A-disaccharide synthase [Nitrospiraceae bacterium]
MKTIMIVTGESSGELYGSLLAKALKEKQPDIRIIGIGGDRMRQAGVEIIAGIASAFGISEVIAAYKKLKKTFDLAVKALSDLSPDLIVLIDYPDFNIRLAKIAKKKNIKILYYVSPQVWAWRKKRANTIADLSDRIAVILPFEEEIYTKLGAECEFVGHPAFEEIEPLASEIASSETAKENIKKTLGLKPDKPVVALLPGSRPHELKSLLPVMLDAAIAINAEYPDKYQLIMPLAPNIYTEEYDDYFCSLKNERVLINRENAIKSLAVSDAAVIASGTATLQSAFLETPLVVIYKLSRLSYFIGKLIVDIKYISIINIIPDKQVVKELLQKNVSAKNIMDELKKITMNGEYRKNMIAHFKELKRSFAGKKPSQRVADMIIEMTS